MKIHDTIDLNEEPGFFDDLMNGQVNRLTCSKCNFDDVLAIPLNVLSGLTTYQLLPIDIVDDPDALDRITFQMLTSRYAPVFAFSPQELACQLLFAHTLENHAEERRKQFENYTVPKSLQNKMQGKYKKTKLKAVSFVSTFFEPLRDYLQDEVDFTIRYALQHCDHFETNMETTHIRSALCELKFLDRSKCGSRYWKIELGA